MFFKNSCDQLPRFSRLSAFGTFVSGGLLSLVLLVASVAANAQSASTESYKLGNGDHISIQVFDEQDLTMEAKIGESGLINYSYLGNIQVAGKTPLELEAELIRLLKDGYLVNPSVNVTIVEYRPFFISGEVKSPGSYPYQPDLTLEKAISIAGGLTDRASTRKMYLVSGDGQKSKESRIKMFSKIQPGDVISIKEGFF